MKRLKGVLNEPYKPAIIEHIIIHLYIKTSQCIDDRINFDLIPSKNV